MYIEGASTNAAGHDMLMLFIQIVVIVSFVLVNGVLIYFVIVYRRRGPNDKTSKLAHSTTIEIVWTLIPSVIMVGMYVWGMIEFLKIRTPTPDAMVIAVEAQQWAWDFTYPAEFRQNAEKATQLKTGNRLYLIEGKPTKLVMKSKDVLHSFNIPAFRTKEDVTPNIYTYVFFTPLIRPGGIQLGKDMGKTWQAKGVEGELAEATGERAVYDIFCTEFCGKDHSYMLGHAVVLKEEDFRKVMHRIEKEAGDVSPEKGRSIYEANCKSCHSLDGSRVVGPSFQGIWGREQVLEDGSKVGADENYIRTAILNPGAQIVKGYPNAMPPQSLSDSQIGSMIEFMKAQK